MTLDDVFKVKYQGQTENWLFFVEKSGSNTWNIIISAQNIKNLHFLHQQCILTHHPYLNEDFLSLPMVFTARFHGNVLCLGQIIYSIIYNALILFIDI